MFKKSIVIFSLLLAASIGYAQEICDNGIDDDGDGLVDINDFDCDCNNLIDLSLIPNPSFEDTLCCPTDEGMLTCAESWVQASDATSDYYHFCGLDEAAFDGAEPPATPLPGGGEGFVGLYNFLTAYREYVGVCTSGPLLAGVSYSLNFHTAYAHGDEDEFELQLYGSPDCADLPWVGTTCPDGIGAWELLGVENIVYTMDGEWQSVTMEFTPAIDMNAIAFGGTCGDIGDTEVAYFYFDELILLETETMGYIEETGGWCSEDLVLTALTDDPGGTWQWYKDGVALPGEISETLSPVPYGPGTFTAVYTYVDGCKQIEYVSPAMPAADFDFTNVCFGETTSFENLSVDPEGEIEDYIWRFDDGETSNEFNPTHTYADPGLYNVELIVFSEDESCNDTATANVSVFAQPDALFEILGDGVSYVGDWIACADHDLLFSDLTTIDGPVSFESWSWDFGNGSVSSEQNPVYAYPMAGTYEINLVVVAENGCSDSIDFNIILNQVVADFVSDTVCQGNPVNFENLSYTSDGSDLITWKWYFGDDTDTSFIENPVHLYELGGVFDAQLYVENAQGCQDSVVKNVYVQSAPDPAFYASSNPTDYFNTQLELIIIYPNPSSSYQWIMMGGTPEFSTEYPSTDVLYPRFTPGEYEVLLIESTELGCVDTALRTISVLEDELIFAPNTFTPNGDPFNDNWGVYVEGFNLDEFRLTLFNRWGEIIWQTDDPTQRWDGTSNNILVPNGIYVWHIKARDQINDEVFEYNGFVTVLK